MAKGRKPKSTSNETGVGEEAIEADDEATATPARRLVVVQEEDPSAERRLVAKVVRDVAVEDDHHDDPAVIRRGRVAAAQAVAVVPAVARSPARAKEEHLKGAEEEGAPNPLADRRKEPRGVVDVERLLLLNQARNNVQNRHHLLTNITH
ncbi:hypothetical protein Q1695_004986 [Nippostrongylus brasiliensis]|nr:hypothetical protein Q1695_004986 [Nippostrongylus brasiliensis]